MSFLTSRKHKSRDSYVLNYLRKGKRKILYLPLAYTLKDAETIQTMVDHLLRCETTGAEHPPFLKTWINSLLPDLRQRLEQAKLIEWKKYLNSKALWNEYIREASTVNKASTMRTYESAMKRFFRFFKPTGNPNDIKLEDGLRWRKELTKHYSAATVAGSVQRTRSVFSWALKNGYIHDNVFINVPRGSFINKDREHYVSMSDYKRLLNACPDQEWRTLLALCRIGGLRNPSETLLLRWSDVDWVEEKILVRSPKTEHHEGKSERVIPLFPELREELTKQKKSASKDAVFVIDRWRDTDRNLRKYFERIIFQAGLEQWPRLFHNLRGSRSNELFSKFPAHVAGNWMGQGDRIAREHYLHPCDNDFAKAIGSDEEPGVPPEELPEEPSEDNPPETPPPPPAKKRGKKKK